MSITGGGFISWMPTDIGNYAVTVSVSDGEISVEQGWKNTDAGAAKLLAQFAKTL